MLSLGIACVRLDFTIPFCPFKNTKFGVNFYGRHFCNYVARAKQSPLEQQKGNCLGSLKSGKMGDFLDCRIKGMTARVSKEALLFHAASKEGGCQRKHTIRGF